jgi:hypothetical protein
VVKPDLKHLPAESVRFYEHAAQLPVMDAAYYLWHAKRELDETEFPRPKRSPPAHLSDELVMRTMRNAIDEVEHG